MIQEVSLLPLFDFCWGEDVRVSVVSVGDKNEIVFFEEIRVEHLCLRHGEFSSIICHSMLSLQTHKL